MAMTIPPVIVPAQPEKVANQLWILTMNVNADNGPTSPVSAYVSVAPYVTSTGEVLRDKMEHINIPDIFAAAQTNPALARAMGYIYASVEHICKERGLFGMLPDPIIPTIESSGPPNITIDEGHLYTFTVTTTGNYLTYQWKKNDAIIDGATKSELTIPSISASDAGVYVVVVTNTLGSVTSNPCTLVVNTAPVVITTDPIAGPDPVP